VVLPGASMVLTSLMGTLSGGIHADNVTLRHFAALFASRAMRCRHWQPAFAGAGFGADCRPGGAARRLAGVVQKMKGAPLLMRCR
jgi:iron(III) transport system permease protein